MDSEIIATLIQENDTLNKKLIETEERLKNEEEITKVLSKRIHFVEQEFRRYVEKMQIYLQTEYDGPSLLESEPIHRSINKEYNGETYEDEAYNKETYNGKRYEDETYNDELFEKPNLLRSTNEHEWSTYNEQIYPLEI